MNNSLPPTAVAAQTEPNKLGHYELLDCIGRGGMGLVYRARDIRLDRQVAIKCLRTELFEHHYVERFKREALLLAKLNHPNIVQIYDFIEAPDQLALVMELVQGQNLQLYLREHIAPFSQRMRWLTEIAQGLAIAHDAGIIHRDLKAENILINQRKVAKITDLGIAKSQDYNATLTDHVAGSYCSMSPEQAMGEAIDFKSDLFSFGILAYQLLCGAHPFGDTNNKLQLMQRIISHPPTAPSKHNPNLPAEINDLLGQLLSKDPTKRPDNTHWVAAQFEKLSHLQPAHDFISDDTQALSPGCSAANQSNPKHTGIKRAVKTQDHPTFETRFIAADATQKNSLWLPIKNYVAENKISVGFGLFSVLILAAVTVWQLQPKPPKYVAVIPPKLTAEGMQESQQELVKGAVYDAIKQSVIQLDGYYLIPQNEIADVNGDNETVRRATAADELITAEIQCKIEVCTINLARLAPESANINSRLRVLEMKNPDVLIDNYLTIATIVQSSIGSFYSRSFINQLAEINENDYAAFLEASQTLRKKGASQELLHKLEGLQAPTKKLPAVQTLYKDVSLDLYYETKNPLFLEKLERSIASTSTQQNSISALHNIYYLQLAQNKIPDALVTIEKINQLNASESSKSELQAYAMMIKNDYSSAISYYKKAISVKETANNLYNISMAYWYSGNTRMARDHLKKSLELSPQLHKANKLYGAIALLDGNIDEAKASFEKIAQQQPNDPYNLSHLGLCYLLAKEYKKASEIFSAAINLAPQNTVFKLNKADAENLAGNTSAARPIYQDIIDSTRSREISNEETRNVIQAHAHLGQYSKALTMLQELEKIDSQNIETNYTAALVHTLANNNASAVLNVENSLRNGMHKIWFSPSWFNSLCKESNFIDLMKSYGEPDRCIPQ